MYSVCNLFKSVYTHSQRCLILRLLTSMAVQVQSLPDTSTKMQQVWQIHSYGDIQQLKLESASIPVITDPTQLLIKVKASALNPIDLQILGGYGKALFSVLRWCKSPFPLILGREFAGTVVDKGRNVSDDEFKLGDEVFGVIPIEKPGTLAEYLVVDKAHVLLRPSQLNITEAASVLYTSITAWSALFLTGGLSTVSNPTNPKVLVIGASGGVGTVAVQLLKSQNITVVGVCSADAAPLVTSLGADFVHDYRDANYVSQVASHGTYDVILDCAKFGYEKVPDSWSYKRFVTLNSPLAVNTDSYGLLGGLAYSAGQLITSNAPRIFNGQRVLWGFFSPQPEAFRFINKLIKNGQLTPIVQAVFKFNDVPEAFKKLGSGHLRGKIVVDLQ